MRAASRGAGPRARDEGESAIEWPGESGLDVVKRAVGKLGLDGWELVTLLPELAGTGSAT